MPPFARWPLSFFASPACIFLPVSPPARAFRPCRREICLRVHAGLCLSSSRRRAFFFLFPRRHDRFDAGDGEFASFCTLAPVVLRLAGVHFSSHFSAGMGVSTLPAGNLPPCARWPLPFFISPACIFHSVSPPACSFRRRPLGICLLLHASPCRSSPRRRAFFFPFLRRLGRFDPARWEFASFCTLAPVVLRLAGVHFSFCFPAGLFDSTLPAGNLPPFARWPLPFFILPACIFHSVSPPACSFRRCPRGICLRVHAGPCRSSPRRRAFFILFPRRHGRLAAGGGKSASFCTLVRPKRGCREIDSSTQRQVCSLRITPASAIRWPTTTILSPFHVIMELCSNSILRGKRHQPLFQDGFWMQPSCGC